MTFSTPAGPVQALATRASTIAPREFVSPARARRAAASPRCSGSSPTSSRRPRGGIEVGGEPPVVARRRRVFGFVFQDSTLLPWRTALQNVLLPLEIGGDARRGRADARASCSSSSGCAASRRPIRGELSGGMRQRVAIARALVTEPQAAPDGRAVRRARRDHARPHEPGAAADLGGDGHDDPLRHPQLARGGVPLRSRAGPGGAARTREARSADRAAATARSRRQGDRRSSPGYTAALRRALAGEARPE